MLSTSSRFAIRCVLLTTLIGLFGASHKANAGTITDSASLTGGTCSSATVSGTISAAFPVNIIVAGNSSLLGKSNTVENGSYSITVTFPTQPANTQLEVTVFAYGTYIFTYTCGDSVPTQTFTDGRLDQDAGQTAAVYCSPTTGVSTYAVQHGTGTFAFSISPNELADARQQMQANLAQYHQAMDQFRAQIADLETRIKNDQTQIDAGVGDIEGFKTDLANAKQEEAHLQDLESQQTPPADLLIKGNFGVAVYISATDGSLIVTGPSLDPTKPSEIYRFHFSC
jgi:hypothetical protein